MARVLDVWRATFPHAVAFAEPPDREVGWVRVMKARVPAFDALASADLAIIPLAALTELVAAPVDAAGVVDAVAEAGGAAVLVVGASTDDTLARQALARAATLGLGAFSLLDGDANALERSVIVYLVSGRAELERQGRLLEQQLERIALDGRDLEAHLAAVAAFIGRAVAIERPRGRPLAVHVPSDVPGVASAAAAYIARPLRAVLRVGLPDVYGEPGALVLLGHEPPTELERAVAERAAGFLALELRRTVRDAASPHPIRMGRHGLPSEGPPWVSIVARQIIAERPSPLEERQSLRAALRRLAPARRLTMRGDATSLELRLVGVADDADPLGLALAERVASVAERQVAVSRPFHDPDERALAEAEARATLESSAGLDPEPWAVASSAAVHRVVHAVDLPAYRLLGAVHDIPDGQRQARALLAPLLEGSAAKVSARLDTLRAILDTPALSAAALGLGIHRNTLAYRLKRMEALTGWDLDDPTVRFAVGMALRIVRNAQI